MEGVLVIKNVSVKLSSFFIGGSIGDQERVCQTLQLHQWREYWWSRSCLSNSSASLLEGVLVIMNVSVKLFNFLWREYWWSRKCLSNSRASFLEGVLVIKNVSIKLFSFLNGGSIGDEGLVCQTLQFLRWRQYWWSRTCLSNSSASSMEGVLVMKNVSVKLFSFFSGGIIGDQERVCQNFSFINGGSIGDEERACQNTSLLEGVLVKNVSVKLFINGGSIGDQERVCQTLQLLQWREYWWSRTCLSNSLASSTGGGIGDEASACQTLLLKLFSFQWREYWWSRTYLSNSSASSMEGVLVIKNVSVKLFSFINVGSIGDQERVCQTLQLHQWREYWWSRTCLSNSSASSMEGVLVIKNVSVKLFSFFSGGSIGDQERVCQTLQLLFWREYWWSRTCLSNSSASSTEGVLVTKDLSVKLFSFFGGGSIGDQERVCQTLQLHQWREYWWWRTCLSNSSVSSVEVLLVIKNVSVKISASLMEGVLVMKNVPVKLFSFFIGGSVGEQERVCQTLQLHKWREYWWSRTCLSNSSASSMEEYWWSRTCLSNSLASSTEGVLVMKQVPVKLFC